MFTVSIIKRAFWAALLAFAAFTGCKVKQGPEKTAQQQGSDIYHVEATDTFMNNAIKNANNTLAIFDQALESGNPDYVNFAVKQAFKTSGNDGSEHIWINNITKDGADYFGVINNQPELTKEVAFGDSIKVDSRRISDWMYLDKGRLRGGYTIRVLRDKMSPSERNAFDAQSGLIIDDSPTGQPLK